MAGDDPVVCRARGRRSNRGGVPGVGRARALALALECAEGDEDLGVDVRDRLRKRLGDATDPAAPPERRESAAAAIAAHELREEFVLTEGTRVCRAPVVRRLFELATYQFVRQPTGSASRRWADDPGSAAVGVTAAEAAGLLAWLNRINVTDGDYRLPTRKDTDDRRFSANQAIQPYSVWLAPEEGRQELELWSGPGAPHPYAAAAGYLRERTKEDTEQVAAALTTLLAFGVAHALAVADGLARVHSCPADGQPGPDEIRAWCEVARRLFLDRFTQNFSEGQRLSFASKLEHAA